MSSNNPPNTPEFESPIEEILISEIQQYLSESTELLVNEELETPNGNYRPDAMLVNNGEIMAIECDGKDFHTGHSQELYDLWRDAFLLFHGRLDFIYRFAGREINYFLSDIIYLLARERPQFFDNEKVKRISSNFTLYFHERFEQHYNNKICIQFYDPEEEDLSITEKQRGFYYSFRDKKRWFPDFGPEALLLGELFPRQSAKQLIESKKSFPTMGDDLFREVELQKPGVLLKYIHFFKDHFSYNGEKGKLIKKYKQLAGYPTEKASVTSTQSKQSYREQNISVWKDIIRKVIPLEFLPESLKWEDRAAIISAIKLLRGYENHVAVFFPNEGDSHLFDVNDAYEPDFVEIHAGSNIRIGRPASLEFIRVVDWPEIGFFKLTFDNVPPIEIDSDRDVKSSCYQTLLEFRPGKYTTASGPEKSYERLIKRYFSGYILLFRNCSPNHPIFNHSAARFAS